VPAAKETKEDVKQAEKAADHGDKAAAEGKVPEALADYARAVQLAPGDITAELLGKHLDAPDVPDPDLIIRTSGEQRLSNFLMWQSAYSELVFVPTYWPDFDRGTLETAIAEYWRRERRFGGLVARTGS